MFAVALFQFAVRCSLFLALFPVREALDGEVTECLKGRDPLEDLGVDERLLNILKLIFYTVRSVCVMGSMSHDSNQCWAALNPPMNFQVPYKVGNFVAS
jgi:hypothetical protein